MPAGSWRFESSASRGGVRVGVIDSGWDRRIDEPRVERGVAFVEHVGSNSPVQSDDDRDRIGHGTSCADIILAGAPRASVVPIRVFGERLETSPPVIVAAIRWAVGQGLRLLNLSLGTLRVDAVVELYRVCDEARQRGTIIVAAGRSGRRSFPAIFDPVIGVGLANTTDSFEVQYRPGEALECRARGLSQRARGLGGRMVVVNGVSFAAPVVSAAVARLLEEHPSLDLDAVREHLAKGASVLEQRSRPV
jgi:subtilisin family serine protease